MKEWIDWFRLEGDFEYDEDITPKITVKGLVNAVVPDWNGNAHTQVSKLCSDISKLRKENHMKVTKSTDKELIMRYISSCWINDLVDETSHAVK